MSAIDAFYLHESREDLGGFVAQLAESEAGSPSEIGCESFVPFADGLRPHPRGIFSAEIFGEPNAERHGWLDVVQVIHPAAYGPLRDALGAYGVDLRAVADGSQALRRMPDGAWQAVGMELAEEADRSGPAGLCAALRELDPSHPLLPLCTIRRVPIPPPSLRPLAARESATQVDPWIGPLNEAWLTLIDCASRERRLLELDAPALILKNESLRVQKAFQAVYAQTRRSLLPLLPPLASVPERLRAQAPIAMAFAGPERLIVQHADRVELIGLRESSRRALPPAGVRLLGVLDGRQALFEEYFDATHPMLVGTEAGFGPDVVWLDAQDVLQCSPRWGEVSVLDCETGAYLAHAPDSLARRRFLAKDQPEDLFLVDAEGDVVRRLRCGGDRPQALAHAPGLTHAWVGEAGCSTEIIELERGIAHAHPVEPDADEVPRWHLLSQEDVAAIADAEDDDDQDDDDQDDDDQDDDDQDDDDQDDDDQDEYGASAVAFHADRWLLLWSSGVLCDHRGRGAVRLTPLPRAAAFDPSGRTLALLLDAELVLVDGVEKKVLRRIPLAE